MYEITFTIEKGRRPPWIKDSELRLPFADLEQGDCFLVCNCIMSAGALVYKAHVAERATGFEFVLENVPGGVRVWRKS